MRNKNQEENWEKELAQFLLSEEILFENEIGEGWIKISEGKQLTGEYQKIINKVAQLLKSEKEMLLERIEKEMEDWRKIADKEETPFLSLLNKDKAGFNDGWRLAINRIYNSWIKLKEDIKNENI